MVNEEQKLIDKSGITSFNDVSQFTGQVINTTDNEKLQEIKKPNGKKVINT